MPYVLVLCCLPLADKLKFDLSKVKHSIEMFLSYTDDVDSRQTKCCIHCNTICNIYIWTHQDLTGELFLSLLQNARPKEVQLLPVWDNLRHLKKTIYISELASQSVPKTLDISRSIITC